MRGHVLYPLGLDPGPTFNWAIEIQPIALEILTQPSRFKTPERDLLADKKGPNHLGQVVFWVIHQFLHIYYCRNRSMESSVHESLDGRKKDIMDR